MTTPRLLSERYELGETLGYGGMSEVHRGRDMRLGRDVAVKVLRADLARDPAFQTRFRREAQNAAALNHPAIVAVYDTGETDTEYGSLPYIVMEYVDGQTLRDIVKTEGPMTPRRALEVMADVCAALDFSHRHGIVHRDVKPANVMITRAGAVKVMDFGIARALTDGQSAVTQTAAVIGTAQYLSPEQARGETVDARSDVYATGCVLFEMLTGEPPFSGDSPVAVAYQHVREDPPRPSEQNRSVPAALDAVVLKALSKNPVNRYQTAAEMRSDMVRVLTGQRPLAPTIMSDEERTTMLTQAGRRTAPAGADEAFATEEAQERRRRNRRRVLIGLATLVLLGLVAFLAATLYGNPAVPRVTVPNVAGEPSAQARQAMVNAGLKPTLVQITSSPDDVNKVIKTDPTAGTAVNKNSIVALDVGRGPDMVPVPSVIGQTPSQAQQTLAAARLNLAADQTTQSVSDPSQVGKVISENPPAGTSVATQTPVTITVGVRPETFKLPNVAGQDQASATNTLQGLGLTVQVAQVDGTAKAGTVVSTDPSGGSTVAQGSTVTLQVSRGNQIQMPDLTGLTSSQAMAKLAQAGWKGGAGGFNDSQTTSVNDPQQDGKVVQQSVPAGQAITTDQPISVVLGSYSAFPTLVFPGPGPGPG